MNLMLALAPWEAALGTSVAIDAPDEKAKLKVPDGTSSGRPLVAPLLDTRADGGLSAGDAAGPGSHGSAPGRQRLLVLVKRVQAEPLMLC